MILRAVRAIVRSNQAVCWRLERTLPHAKPDPLDQYRLAVKKAVRPGDIILDVGGGISCSYADDALNDITVIAMDISAEELKPNRDAQAKLVANASAGLPLLDNSVDVITSRFLLEHLRDPEPLIREARRVLRPGGRMVHLCPSTFAPFAVLNRAIPNKIARLMLTWLTPTLETHHGFRAYYNQTYHSALVRIVRQHGFKHVRTEVSYYQSPYFAFFLPFFLISVAYELICYRLNLKDLSATVLVMAASD